MLLRRKLQRIAAVLLAAWFVTVLWQTNKPLPAGVHINVASALVPVQEVRFLYDLTYQTPQGERRSEQQIFDAVLKQIDEAQNFIVLDYFLFNDAMGGTSSALEINLAQTTVSPYRKLSHELAEHLLARKRAIPTLQVLFITDPINDVYGGAPSPLLGELQVAGIEVVRAKLGALRDSNAGYSAIWRAFGQWWGNSTSGGWLPNPFDKNAAKITLRSWLALLNFKANHRKLIISDRPDGDWQVLVASANPHDASSAHSNVAVQASGELAQIVLDGELDLARFSGWKGDFYLPTRRLVALHSDDVEADYLTEGSILERILPTIGNTEVGDQIELAMFYLSERSVINALKAAAERGVKVRLILDPNKDAFGIQKDGVPNRPVANELVAAGAGRIQVRWYRTAGEQFHTKLLMVHHQNQLLITLGSANFTRRNLNDYNLEADVALNVAMDTALAQQTTAYFERLWQDDALSSEYTAPFDVYRDDSTLRYWRYRFMEATGLSTF